MLNNNVKKIVAPRFPNAFFNEIKYMLNYTLDKDTNQYYYLDNAVKSLKIKDKISSLLKEVIIWS